MSKDALTDKVAKKHYETMHGSRCMTTQKSDITLPRGRPTGNIPQQYSTHINLTVRKSSVLYHFENTLLLF